MFITAQEAVTVSIWMFNILPKKDVVCCHSTNYLTINKISTIFLNKLIMESYGYT